MHGSARGISFTTVGREEGGVDRDVKLITRLLRNRDVNVLTIDYGEICILMVECVSDTRVSWIKNMY